MFNSKSVLLALFYLAIPLGSAAQEAPIKSFALSSHQQAAMGVGFAVPSLVETGSVLISASVTVPPDKQAIVSAPYPGQITKMLVDIGDTVKAGSP